jgi:hypothetical protein
MCLLNQAAICPKGFDGVHYTETEVDTINAAQDAVINTKLDTDIMGVELNIMADNTVAKTEGYRPNTSGDIIPDAVQFYTDPVPVTEGVRYSSVSTNVGAFPVFTYYNSATPSGASFISQGGARESTVPAGATHMMISTLLIYMVDDLIVMPFETGYPELGQDTFQFSNTYRKTEVDALIENQIFTTNAAQDAVINTKLDTDIMGVELNIMADNTVAKTEGYRPNTSGDIIPDAVQFYTDPVPVTEGVRYSSVSTNVGAFPVFTYYNSATPSGASFISQGGARESTVPAGATHMMISTLLIYMVDDLIVMPFETGYPELGQDTFQFSNTYSKTEVDELIENQVFTTFYPSVFDLEIIDIVDDTKIFVIDENDVLYGSNGFRDVIKATQYDLSDAITVVQLNSLSTLQKLIFVSANKACGYVRSSVPADEGFYCFDNADTDTWAARRVGIMDVGAPALEFQSFIKTPDSSHLFASSYGDKVTDLEDLVTEPPRHVYRSTDLGETWSIVYTHADRFNTHIHAVCWDTFRDRLWVTIGDEGGGGMPGWAYSDDYGDSFTFVENDDTSGQEAFMDTAIIPTRRYVLFGSDYHPAGVRKWRPPVDGKNEAVSNADVTTQYYVPVVTTNNFGFARNPVVDTSSYPYKIAMPFTHTAAYSQAAMFISPNFVDWYMLNLVPDPINDVSWSALSGITSDGWVIGYCTLTGVGTYRRFKFPDWVRN